MPNPEMPSNNQDGNLTKNLEQEEIDKLNQERGKKTNEAKIEKDREETSQTSGYEKESDGLEAVRANTLKRAKNNKGIRTLIAGAVLGVGATLLTSHIVSEMNKDKTVQFDDAPTTSVSDTLFEQSGDTEDNEDTTLGQSGDEVQATTISEGYHETINNPYFNRYDGEGLYNDKNKFSADSVANSERVARYLFNKGKNELTIDEQKEAYYYVISHEAEPLAHFLRQTGMHGFENLTYSQAVAKLKNLSKEESENLLEEVKDVIRDAKGEYRTIPAGTEIENFYMTRGADGKMKGEYRKTTLKNDELAFDLIVDHGNGTKSRSTFLLRCYNGGVEMSLILDDGTEQKVDDNLETTSINIWIKIIAIFKKIDIDLHIDNTDNTKVIKIVHVGGHNKPKPQEVVPKTENAHGGEELTTQDYNVSYRDVVTQEEEEKIVESNETNIVAQPGDESKNNEINNNEDNINIEDQTTPHFTTTGVTAQDASMEGERLPGGEDQSSTTISQNNAENETQVNGEGVDISQYQTGSEESEKKAEQAAYDYFKNQSQKTSSTGNGNSRNNNKNSNSNRKGNGSSGNNSSKGSNGSGASKSTTASQSSVNAVAGGKF